MPDHRIPAIDRAIDVLDALAGQPGASITQLAARLIIPRSTVYRILNSLETHAVVLKDSDGGYRLGPRLLRLASAVAIGADLVSISRPHLDQLATTLECTVKLSVRDGLSALVVAVAEGPQTYSITTQVGRRFPLHAGAASKVLLAQGDAELFQQVTTNLAVGLTATTITDPSMLETELERVRVQGFAEDNGEFVEGVNAVAAPIFDAKGDCVAAVSVPYVAVIEEERSRHIRTHVVATARIVTRHLGGRDRTARSPRQATPPLRI